MPFPICPYCFADPVGHHAQTCPLRTQTNPTQTGGALTGWICPQCRSVYAPWVSKCWVCQVTTTTTTTDKEAP